MSSEEDDRLRRIAYIKEELERAEKRKDAMRRFANWGTAAPKEEAHADDAAVNRPTFTLQ